MENYKNEKSRRDDKIIERNDKTIKNPVGMIYY